MDSSFFI
jgi:hypothetical protein